jgi:hypothetical protein
VAANPGGPMTNPGMTPNPPARRVDIPMPPQIRASSGLGVGVRPHSNISQGGSPPSPMFPHAGDHGGSLFNHPSTNRATASLASELGVRPRGTMAPAKIESASSRAVSQARKDLAGHNRSGS